MTSASNSDMRGYGWHVEQDAGWVLVLVIPPVEIRTVSGKVTLHNAK